MNPQEKGPNTTELDRSVKERLWNVLQGHPDVSGVGLATPKNGVATLLVFLSKDSPSLVQEIKEFQGHPVEFMVSGPVIAYAKDWSSATLPPLTEDQG
jgi:hypothetical protein